MPRVNPVRCSPPPISAIGTFPGSPVSDEDELMATNQGIIHWFLTRSEVGRVAVKNLGRDEAEAVANIGLLMAIRRHELSSGTFFAWACIQIRSQLQNRLRDFNFWDRRLRFMSGDDEDRMESHEAASVESVDAAHDSKVIRDYLMSKGPAGEAFLRRFGDGLSSEQVASEMGRSRRWVDKSIERVRGDFELA